MIQLQSVVDVADNTGAKQVMVFRVMKGSTSRRGKLRLQTAGIGDIVPSIERPTEYMSTNVLGTVHALEGARAAGARKFVYAASSSCYGIADELPTTEQAPIRP